MSETTKMATPSPTYRISLLIVLVVGILLVFAYPVFLLARMLSNWQITGFDDAYMFARYAIHWNMGKGLMVWNIGEAPIYGPTSLSYVPMVALFMRVIPFEPGIVLPIVSWTMGVLTLLILYGISRTLIHDWASPPAFVVMACLLWLVLEPAFAFHTLSGMDTMFFTLAIAVLTWSCLLLRQKANVPRFFFFTTLCAVVSYLVRPDNILYALLLPSLAIVLAPVFSKRWLIIFTVVFACFVFTDLLIKRQWLGDIFPLSFTSNRTGDKLIMLLRENGIQSSI